MHIRRVAGRNDRENDALTIERPYADDIQTFTSLLDSWTIDIAPLEIQTLEVEP